MQDLAPLNLAAIDVMHVVPLGVAFLLGLVAKAANLPPLMGFLAAGFILGALGMHDTPMLEEIADLGVTLLLFTIGLKLHVKDLAAPVVWLTASVHMLITTVVVALLLSALALTGLSFFSAFDTNTALLIGFALSFSSTVFAVKVFEGRAEMSAIHGRIAIGLLIVQDIFAVVFIAISAGKVPSVWAFLLFALIPLRPLFFRLLEAVGHGELLVLMGWLLPLVGAGLFELVGIKADLGALVLGILLAGHAKTNELAKSLLSFKDLFLIGFFLSIGLSGELSWAVLGAALLLVLLLLPLKALLYFLLMTRQHMRARSATLASAALTNFSEFGLIVGAIGVTNGWLDGSWLSVLAVALALSFLLASPLNAMSKRLYARWRHPLHRFETRTRLPGDDMIRPGKAQVVVFGMGRVGTGAYDYLRSIWGDVVLGIDINADYVDRHSAKGRNVVLGDATDADFWARAERSGRVKLALLAFSDHESNMAVARLLKEQGFELELASVAHYPDHEEALRSAGVNAVFNFYASAGESFAEHVAEEFGDRIDKELGQPA
ncbi:cation:proton antiporter family protein [Thiosocius teredinicola]|uniref:cation:proton antiporter family protein n=1 Tax=Thiosocius teredinicola TaxID=1973002 RepID=UPI002FE4C1E9